MKNFKDNQKVRHPKYGEGIFNNFEKFPNTYTIAFEEFSTQVMQIGNDFYNQLEPIEDLPNVGEYAYFWDDDKLMFFYGIFKGRKLSKYKYEAGNNESAFGSYQYISKTPPKFD